MHSYNMSTYALTLLREADKVNMVVGRYLNHGVVLSPLNTDSEGLR